MKIKYPRKVLKILVEGYTDKAVVESLLKALDINIEKTVNVVVCDGKKGVREKLHEIPETEDVVALIDADAPSVADSIAWAREYLQTTRKSVFCAVPTIESWLFADKNLALKNARKSSYAQSSIARITTTESLINPKHLVNQVFDKDIILDCFPFMENVDLGTAAAASASLFSFLRGIETALGKQDSYVERKVSQSINRLMVANLLREVPATTISWRTLDSEFTARELGDLVLQGDELGLRYVSDLLRLARDIIAARAQDKDTSHG
jgi:hypothetical protein